MQYDTEYFESEEFQELLSTYEESLTDDDYLYMDADDLADIADYYTMKEEPDKARKAIDHALWLHPNSTLPNVFKAREAIKDNDYVKAHRHLDAISDTEDPDYHYLKAELLVAEGKVYSANKYLKEHEASVSEDEYEDFIRDAANLFADYGHGSLALRWVRKAKGDDSFDFKVLMGQIYLLTGKLKKVMKIYNELIDADPYNVNLWEVLASVQYLSKMYSEAVTSAGYALAINPKSTQALAIKGICLIRLGNGEEALEYIKRYNEIIPDDYPFLAACSHDMNSREDFLFYLKLACKEDPEGTRQAVGNLFPKDLEVRYYYNYALRTWI